RVEHALVAERLLQTCGGAEHAAVDANVLAEHDDAVVVAHLVGQGLGDRLDEGDGCRRAGLLLSHCASPMQWPARAGPPVPLAVPRRGNRTSLPPVAPSFPGRR